MRNQRTSLNGYADRNRLSEYRTATNADTLQELRQQDMFADYMWDCEHGYTNDYADEIKDWSSIAMTVGAELTGDYDKARDFAVEVFEGIGNGPVTEMIREQIDPDHMPEVAVHMIRSIHDKWVYDNLGNFEEKLRDRDIYQCLPVEMIGWQEASKDWKLANPVLEHISGTELPGWSIRDEYTKQAKEFFEKYLPLQEGENVERYLAERIKDGIFSQYNKWAGADYIYAPLETEKRIERIMTGNGRSESDRNVT